MQGKNAAILDALCAPSQRPLYWSMSLTGRIPKSWVQGVESGVALTTITLNDSPGEVLPVIPATLGFVGLKVLTPQKGTLLPRDSNVPIELQAVVALGTLHFLCIKTRGQESSHSLGRATVPNQQVEVGLLLHSGGREEYTGNSVYFSVS